MWWTNRIAPFNGATASLCLTAITHTYLLFHCFPYVGYMAVQLDGHFVRDATVDSAGLYAGLLGTAFTTGRCLSFVPWKMLRQRFSVKATLLFSLFLSALCSLWFGTSRTFLSALAARFGLGLSNTLSGCVKRIAIDRERRVLAAAKKDDDKGTKIKEELAPARVLAVMWWGSAIGPCLGGYLSNSGTYSEKTIIMPDSIEEVYPFLLPNIVAALLCFVSMILVNSYIADDGDELMPTMIEMPNTTTTTEAPASETHPLLKKESSPPDEEDNSTPANNMTKRGSLLTNKVDAFKFCWKSPNTRYHLLAYWAFSFVVVCVDEALPLFLIARLAGPGLSPYKIGWILSGAGLLVVLSQSLAVERILAGEEQGLGIYPSLRVASILGNVPSVLVPLMLWLNGGTYYYLNHMESAPDLRAMEALGQAGDLSWGSFLFLIALVGFLRVFCSIYFSLIGVATGRTVSPSHRDEVARIMTLGALCARAVAPVVAGALVTAFLAEPSDDGVEAVALWVVIGLAFGLGAAVLSFRIKESCETCDPQVMSERESRSERHSLYLDGRKKTSERLWKDHEGSQSVGAKWSKLVHRAIWYNAPPDASKEEEDAKEDNSKQQAESTSSLSVSKPHHHRRTTWIDHVLRPGLDPYKVDFFILGTHKYDKTCLPHVLTPPLMEALHRQLPMSCAEDNFWLKYSLLRDGASMHMLESKIAMTKNTFIAIETLEGDVLGCFMAQPWRRTGKYEMSGESFLWRMNHQRVAARDPSAPPNEDSLNEIAKREGDVSVYRWTGENDDCQLLSHDRIAAGGGMMTNGSDGFGFILQDNLSTGSSSPCLTYGNPCLISTADGRFEVANIEVWAMTPFLFSADAERSQATIRFVHQNLNTGDAPSSAQSAWTNFL